MTVLVVEDDEALADAMAATLEEEGLDVMVALNGRAALDALRARPRPGLILLDIAMPVMNGWEFRREQLRDKSLAGIPVVICTADGRAAEAARQLGAAGVLTKPLSAPELIHAVLTHCQAS